MYASENTIIISDILDPESWNLTTQSLTLDPIKTDYITGDVPLARATDRGVSERLDLDGADRAELASTRLGARSSQRHRRLLLSRDYRPKMRR